MPERSCSILGRFYCTYFNNNKKNVEKNLDKYVKMANKNIYNVNHNGIPSVKYVNQVLSKCHISILHKTARNLNS